MEESGKAYKYHLYKSINDDYSSKELVLECNKYCEVASYIESQKSRIKEPARYMLLYRFHEYPVRQFALVPGEVDSIIYKVVFRHVPSGLSGWLYSSTRAWQWNKEKAKQRLLEQDESLEDELYNKDILLTVCDEWNCWGYDR